MKRIGETSGVSWFAVQRDQFRLDRGDGELVRFASSDHGTRSFCGRCGSTLFCESTRHPEQVDVVLTNLHGPSDRKPQVHGYWDDRTGWTVAADGLPKLGGETGLEAIDDG